jgi:hypothetical protein
MKLHIILETNEGEILVSKTVSLKEDNENGDRIYPDFRVLPRAIDEAFEIRDRNLINEANQLTSIKD